MSPTPYQSWVFLFLIYISDFSSINVKKYMQNTYSVLIIMYTQKFCIIVTILLLVLHSF